MVTWSGQMSHFLLQHHHKHWELPGKFHIRLCVTAGAAVAVHWKKSPEKRLIFHKDETKGMDVAEANAVGPET